jgi:SAM-dependent methyltransferase
MYFEFAITTNERGRVVAALLQPYRDLRGATYLDIGCAYGGFLVAFAEAGARVAGIDIDPGLLDLARHNLADRGIDAPLLLGDATTLATLAEFRSAVDVATCNDVIEHVASPAALVETIAQLLAPGGLCYLEIPNAWLPQFVQSDGHFQLFGITPLSPADAERYWNERYPDQPYSRVTYLALDEYDRLFREAGLSMEVLPETLAHVMPASIDHQIAALAAGADEGLATVPPGVRETVARELRRYHAEFAAFPRDDQRRFLLTYGASFWKVVVRRGLTPV